MKMAKVGGVRFAPSPTGRFHVGNLRTAWISYEWAQALQVPWVVRFEDIDAPRSAPGARELQLADMQAIGLTNPLIVTQSEFRDHHWDLFMAGVNSGQIYPCDCSRKEVQTALATLASAPHAPVAHYSGHCRELRAQRSFHALESLAWRFRMPDSSGHDDIIVARTRVAIAPDKASFTPAYHWACAIDDFEGEHLLLVRSHDLQPATPLQRALQTWLGRERGEALTLPAVFHTSLITQNDGHRLEKRTPGVMLPELQARGISAHDLPRKFAASFARDVLSRPLHHELGWGEPDLELTLHDLGL